MSQGPIGNQPTEPKPNPTPHPAAKTKEGDVRGRPHRAVPRISIGRPRPPHPRTVVNEPAPVVIRSPAPGLIRNPGPTPARLPHPASAAIGRPTRARHRRPHRTVVRHRHPASVSIKVFRAYVVAIGISPRLGVENRVVTVDVPRIPTVFGRARWPTCTACRRPRRARWPSGPAPLGYCPGA